MDMEQKDFEPTQTTPPRRRRRRTKWQDFRDAYLPFVVIGIAAVMILIFIIGSALRGGETEDTVSTDPPLSQADLQRQEAQTLMAQAAQYAANLDYEEAINCLTSFSGDMTTIEGMVEKYNEYSAAFAALVPYTAMDHVPNLSVNLLIADLSRALSYQDYGDRLNRNYLTCDEFREVLQGLYDNGYMLISIYDAVGKVVDADGSVTLKSGRIYLPEGKKPIILTQTGVNYNTYLVDGDGDGLADKDGAGFASRLIVDENGNLTNEMVDAQGNTVTGAYDFIPILEEFIAQHPDFSYKGARATIAVTGYDGLFGYRTDPETAKKISQDYYEQQLSQVKPVIQALRDKGYDLACYTYDMASYGEMSLEEVQADLTLWEQEVKPLLGDVDILVYPNGSDILGREAKYSGSVYDYLRAQGFSYFIGQESATKAWGQITENYMRQTRRQLAPNIMYYSYTYFDDVFQSQSILDEARGTIPY